MSLQKKYFIFSLLMLFSCKENNIEPIPIAKDVISINTVYSFAPGEGQNAGQDSLYFPKNVFGLPGTPMNIYTSVSAQDDILSIGLGGEIIVGFKGFYIVDGDGVDFKIFENVFLYQENPKKYFVEPAKVSVSSNGIDYIEFPYDINTLEGCAGLMPTIAGGSLSAYGNGDSFDLAEIGISQITHIKITDLCIEIIKDTEHIYYSPILSGFDLDAVIGINFEKKE